MNKPFDYEDAEDIKRSIQQPAKRRYILNFVGEVAPKSRQRITVLSEVIFKPNEILVATPDGFTINEVIGDGASLMFGLPLPAAAFSQSTAVEMRSLSSAHAVDAQKEFALDVTNETDAALRFRGHLLGFGSRPSSSVLLERTTKVTEEKTDRTAADVYLEPREYVAANLRDALSLVPDTGDWHGQLRHWCDAQGGKYEPNRCSDQVSYYEMRDERDKLRALLEHPSDFASGFRAGVAAARQVAIDNARSLTGTGQGMAVDIAEEIALLEPPQQPDAAPSDKVWTDLEDIARRLRDLSAAHLEDRKRCHAALAAWQALGGEYRREVLAVLKQTEVGYRETDMPDVADGYRDAVALLRSLAPEAGDADGGGTR